MGVGDVNRSVVGDCRGEMLPVGSGDRRVGRHMEESGPRWGEYRRGGYRWVTWWT